MPELGFGLIARSCWWRSKAWPDPSKRDYLNGVVLVETGREPGPLLDALMRMEHAFGRRRGAANDERTLDLDLIAHGRRIIRAEGLIVPHPRAAERLFVMGPLAEIAPDWRHPLPGKTARALARAASVGLDAAPAAGFE
jgi:2-amino-4-hydroxy-6-hydroxymethyldihydropteridine diphosphokinase